MSNIIDSIQLSGVTYTLQGSGGGGNPTVELTQAQYDALVSAGTVNPTTYYIITDAEEINANEYVTKAQNVASGLTVTIEKTNPYESIHSVKEIYLSADTNCEMVSVVFNSDYFGSAKDFDFSTTPTFDQDYIRVDFDSTTRTYHVWSTDAEFKFNNIYVQYYYGSQTFKLWTYTWQIPSGQTASVLNSALPQLVNKMDLNDLTAVKSVSIDSNTTSKTNWNYSYFKNNNNYQSSFKVCDGTSIINQNGLKLGTIPTQQIRTTEILSPTECTQTPFGNNNSQDNHVDTFDIKFNYNLNDWSQTGNRYSTVLTYFYGQDDDIFGATVYIYVRNNNGTFEVAIDNDNTWSSDYTSITNSIRSNWHNLNMTISSDGISYTKTSNETSWISYVFFDGICMYYGTNPNQPFSSITSYDYSINIYDAVDTLFAEYESGGTSGGITSGEVQTMIDSSISGKVNTSAITSSVTSASTDSEIPTAKAVFDAIPTGGGATYSAGRGIDITNDTISVSLPISAGTGTNSIAEGTGQANANYSHAEGRQTITLGFYSHAEGWNAGAIGQSSHAEGYSTLANGRNSHVEGSNTTTSNDSEHASGKYNVSSSASTDFGDSGNTLFSVGNGTSSSARHNAFEIRQNGDIYLSSGGTDIKLQDYLGGGSITVDTALDSGSTNPVANSAITEAVNSKVNISDNNVSAFSDFKVALESGKDYTSDNISTFYLGRNKATGSGTNDLVTITTTDVNYPTITINCSYSNGNITQVRTTSGITSSVENGIAQITLTGGSLVTVNAAFNSGVVFLYKQYTSGQTADVVEDTVYDALKELSNNKLDYIYKDEIINSKKTFLWGSSGSDKPIIFKQTNNSAKIGFTCQNSASTNNEIATFEFRPDTYTDSSSVKHPLLYFGHYRNTATANAGVVQTMVGFRQYDQKGAAAYHYLIPLPAEAKTPFRLTTSFKNYFAPLGFKNGSTMITADNTGVADFSSVLGGLKLVKITQSAYDALTTKDSSTLYVIVN